MKISEIKNFKPNPLRVWLDDERPVPNSTWIAARWPEDAIKMLRTGRVSEISLDHDLGDDEHGTGYDVLLWIEEEVHTNKNFKLPAICIHTANPSASDKMHRALDSIERFYRSK